jgi:hypothetical protein
MRMEAAPVTKILQEPYHVLLVMPSLAETIYRLLVITNDEDVTMATAELRGELVLQEVCILEFVYEHMLEFPTDVFTHLRIRQQKVC